MIGSSNQFIARTMLTVDKNLMIIRFKDLRGNGFAWQAQMIHRRIDRTRHD